MFPLYSEHLIGPLESKEWDLYDSNLGRVTKKKIVIWIFWFHNNLKLVFLFL